jgi:hypothetical protein
LPDLPQNVAGKERRDLVLGRMAKKIPQLLVMFAFHKSSGRLN